MICPFLGGQCVKRDCALWFQEISRNDLKPVANMCGCSMQMTAEYLMEMRPFVMEVEDIAIRQSMYFDKFNEKLGLLNDKTSDILEKRRSRSNEY
jgi:hypothetical protein